jgi:hypothetical protein
MCNFLHACMSHWFCRIQAIWLFCRETPCVNGIVGYPDSGGDIRPCFPSSVLVERLGCLIGVLGQQRCLEGKGSHSLMLACL